MNFLIFRDFSRIFLIFYEFNSIYFEIKMNKKLYFFSRANVADDVAEATPCRHVAVYEHATWRTRILVCAGVRAYARVCIRVRVCD